MPSVAWTETIDGMTSRTINYRITYSTDESAFNVQWKIKSLGSIQPTPTSGSGNTTTQAITTQVKDAENHELELTIIYNFTTTTIVNGAPSYSTQQRTVVAKYTFSGVKPDRVKTTQAYLGGQNNVCLEGSLTTDGRTNEYGFVYQVGNVLPTVAHKKVLLGTTTETIGFKHTLERVAAGIHSFRAYAISGEKTYYGSVLKVVVPSVPNIGAASLRQDGNLFLAGEINERTPLVTNGLSSHFPMDGTTKGKRFGKNLLDTSLWKVGTGGSQGYFGVNGIASEANIIEYKNPWGKEEPTWAVIKNDVTSDSDGGWNATGRPIDNTKKYRLSVWIKRENMGMGTTYFGCQASTVTSLKTTTVNTNPYFTSGKFPETYDDWALFVGYIHPHDYPDASDPTNGVYKRDGVRVRAVTDFKWTPTATLGGHRTYLYYTTDVDERCYWVRPRFEVCDGSEPSIAELIAGQEYDIHPSANTNNTLTNYGIAVEEATTNLWTGTLSPYNNYTVPATFVKLDETYMGQPVYRLGMTVTDAKASYLSHFQSSLSAHGVNGGAMSWVQDTKYASSIYWRPVNKPDTVFGGTASNTSGWVAGPTEYLEDGWRRFTRYRTGVGVATKSDSIHHSFYCPSLQLNETIYIDFTCPQTEMGKTFATSYTPSTRGEGDFKLNNVLSPGKGSVVLEVTFHEDNTINGEQAADQYCFGNRNAWNVANSFWFHDVKTWFIKDLDGTRHDALMSSPMMREERTQLVLVYDDTDGTMDIYKNGILVTDGTKKTAMIGKLGQLRTDWTHSGHAEVTTYKMCQTIHSLSFYNRPLTAEEAKSLAANTFSVQPSGNVLAKKVVEGAINIPADALHFPMDLRATDKKLLAKPMLENGVAYTEGGVWVGSQTKNVLNGSSENENMQSKTEFGWEQITATGATGKKRFFADLAFLTSGSVYTVSATVRNPMSKPIYINLAWCGSNSFHKLKPNEIKRISTSGSAAYTNALRHADIGLSTGDSLWIKEVQLEQGGLSPYVETTRNYSRLNYKGTDLTTNNWQEFSFFITAKYSQSGVHRLSGAWPRWYFGLNTDGTLLFSWTDGTQKFVYSGAIIPTNTWATIGVTVKNNVAIDIYYNGNRVAGHGAGFNLSSTAMDFALNSIDATSVNYPLNAVVKDMVFAPRAFTPEEIKIMHGTAMSPSLSMLQVKESVKEKVRIMGAETIMAELETGTTIGGYEATHLGNINDQLLLTSAYTAHANDTTKHATPEQTARWDAAEKNAIDFVKASGVGGAVKNISSTNLNDLATTGFFLGGSLINAPAPGVWFYIINMVENASYKRQLAFPQNNTTASEVWTRNLIGEQWTSWVRLLSSDMINKPNGVAGLNAKGQVKNSSTIDYLSINYNNF